MRQPEERTRFFQGRRGRFCSGVDRPPCANAPSWSGTDCPGFPSGGILSAMFLRRNRRIVAGECYEYWPRVKTVRTANGPRQALVAPLGKTPGLESRTRHGWEQVADLREGRTPAGQGELGCAFPAAPQPQWAQVDLRGGRGGRVREFGPISLALALWRRVGLHPLLKEISAAGPADVPWELTACNSAGGALLRPAQRTGSGRALVGRQCVGGFAGRALRPS